MRRDFVAQVILEMERDPSIVFLTGDLGFNALEQIREKFPDRFLNVGIAEQHLVGMASGLALEGKKVIAYSIASFATMRPYEQIRNDVCYQNLDVKIVGTGGGYNYASHGVTHHTVEDVAIMNVLPHMKVLCPGYSWEAREATKAMVRHKGPAYIRLGKSPGIEYEKGKRFSFSLGKGFVVKEGKDIMLLSTGNVLDVVLATAQFLEKQTKCSVCVISMPSIKPFDRKLFLNRVHHAKGVFTVEEHSTTGGLGSVAASVLAENGISTTFRAFGFPAESFLKDVGDRDYLLARVGLEPGALARAIKREMSKK